MVEAAKTTASAAGIWAIVIVAVVALAAWLTAIMLADRSQVRASGPQVRGQSALIGSGAWGGGSVPGARAPNIPEEATIQADPGAEAAHGQASGPVQATGTGQHAMPRQRTGEADRAERSHAGPGPRDDEQRGR